MSDETTIFGRIIDGEIPCHRVYEDEHVLARPQAQELRAQHRPGRQVEGTPGLLVRQARGLALPLGRHEVGQVDDGQREELEAAGLNIRVEHRLADVLPELDVVYINAIAWVGDTFERLTGDMKLSANSPLKSDAIVLHPLARGDELDPSLDETPHNWYFAQARGAVFIRMALLTCLTQRIGQVADVPLPTLHES